MNKSMILSFALCVASLASLGGASMASAKDVGHGKGHNATGFRQDRDTRTGDFTGVWRLDARRGDARGDWRNGGSGRADEYRGYRNDRAAYLPDVIQIERDRRELRVENQNGRLVRRLEMGRRGDWNGGQFQVESTVRGARVTETFSLQNRGRELVVRTIVQGPRGTQQFTSIYDRA